MTGYMMVVAACYGCGKTFSSNPDKVPSFENQPICRSCITLVNQNRAENGLPQWPVSDDAYEPTEAL